MILNYDKVENKDKREFDASLLKLLYKLQSENNLLKDKLEHLEKMLLNTPNIPIIKKELK